MVFPESCINIPIFSLIAEMMGGARNSTPIGGFSANAGRGTISLILKLLVMSVLGEISESRVDW